MAVAPDESSPETDLAVFTSDEFRQTEIHRRWKAQGVTDKDITQALASLRDQGFSGVSLRDPALVAQFLPARNITPVYIDRIDLTDHATANAPVPFHLQANFPSPAYAFESWEISRTGSVVTVKPKGHRRAEPVASVVVPVQLDGALPGLPAGSYTIRFEAIGSPFEFPLTVQ